MSQPHSALPIRNIPATLTNTTTTTPATQPPSPPAPDNATSPFHHQATLTVQRATAASLDFVLVDWSPSSTPPPPPSPTYSFDSCSPSPEQPPCSPSPASDPALATDGEFVTISLTTAAAADPPRPSYADVARSPPSPATGAPTIPTTPTGFTTIPLPPSLYPARARTRAAAPPPATSADITRWTFLFHYTAPVAAVRIAAHRGSSVVGRAQLVDDAHWCAVGARMEARGYDREAYEHFVERRRGRGEEEGGGGWETAREKMMWEGWGRAGRYWGWR